MPLIVGEVVGKNAGDPVEAVVTVGQLPRALEREPARENVTELQFPVAHLGSNIQELLRKAEGIAPLEKCSGQDRIQAAQRAHAHAILAAIGPDYGVPKDRIRVGGYVSHKERRHLDRPPAQAVAHFGTEILQASMIRAVVKRNYCRGVSTNVLMRGRTDDFPVI